MYLYMLNISQQRSNKSNDREEQGFEALQEMRLVTQLFTLLVSPAAAVSRSERP